MAAIFSAKGLAEGSGNPVAGGSNEDRSKEWQMELLMEKLRSKSGQFKSFIETAKALRMSLLEKRYPCDNVERNQLQKCLDTLQHSIKVTSLQGMVERLESVTRQLGLKFMAGQTGLDWFISSDMFYLEVVLEATGGVKDVKIHHEGKVEQQSCEELVSCLSRGDFTDFTAQLEGLAAIYQLNAEKKVKCKAFSALQSLETDLGSLASVQMMIKEPFNLVHKSPVGIVEKRRGGHAMKLTYLVSPYDLLDAKTGSALPLTVQEVVDRQLGYSALVCMEGSIAHKLPTTPLITISRGVNGKSAPVYTAVSAANSCTLPACFVLRLSKPLPMCLSLVKKVTQLTDLECGDISSPHPLLSLITQHASAGAQDTHKGLFVSLPDQQHCYFMTETKGLEGILVTSIPFTHPSHVPQILVFLRQQALFNTLIGSCIRSSARQDLESMIMFEVNALSWQHLSISLEHPQEETLATAELDLSDIGSVKCSVFGSGLTSGEAASHHATKVLQRCLSIPVTMRSLIRSWQTHMSHSTTLPNSAPSSGDPGSQGPDFDLSRVKTEPERPSYNNGESSEPSFQPPGDSSFLVMNDKKSRKRKTASGETWPNKRKPEDCEILVESSSEESTSGDRQSDDEILLDLDEVENRPRKQKKEKPAILVDLDTKPAVAPSVSITPIGGGPAFNSVLTGMGLERRPGIEIIPISSSPSPSLPSSITITAIQGKPVDRDKKRPREDKNRLDKKRKRKREDGSDALNKPVSVSIKPAERSSDSKSVGGSGKPSMSALKSATGSPNKDSSKLRTQSKEKDRKDTPKVKSSSVKTKPSESSDGTLPSGAPLPQARNRKGSLSAIVDKLKSAQHCGPEGEVKPNSTPKTPGEYMVKPSSDGMRITINKTRTKDSKGNKSSSSSSSSSGSSSSSSSSNSSNSSQQGSGSPKTHTGLKPGVNSGPASKKPHTTVPSKNSSSKTSSGKLPSAPKPSSPIPGALSKTSKGQGSPKPGERRDKMRPSKPGEKSPVVKGKASPVLELEGYKMLTQHAKIEPSAVVEGLGGLIKSLDTKFQIPKLSARNQEPDAKKVEKVDSLRTVDLAGKNDQKFLTKSVEDKPAKPATTVASTPVSKLSPPIGSSIKGSPPVGASLKASPPIGSGLKASSPISSSLKASPPVGSGLKASPPIGASLKVSPPVGVNKTEDTSLSTSSVSTTSEEKHAKEEVPNKVDPSKVFTEPAAPPIKVPCVKPDEPRKQLLTTEYGGTRNTSTTPQEAAEMLLDFSASSNKPECSVPERALAAAAPPRRNTPPPPAVTMVTIVKSPAPSPHSAPSPCLTDDELMDEALVGLGKS